jgi:hypothetical protein
METSMIEKLDKARYNLLKWLTVGWGTWFGSYILKDLIKNGSIILDLFIGLVGLVGFVFFAVNLQKYMRLASKVKYSRLSDALNNEMHQLYKYKSIYIGFKVLLTTIILFFIISLFNQIPSKFVCEITLYFGVLSSLIAGLIYNRD